MQKRDRQERKIAGQPNREERRMKIRITTLVLFDVLAAFAVASAGGQAQWDERAVQGGVEFRLRNDQGTAIVLQCTDQEEVHAAFAFTEPIEAAGGRPGDWPDCGRGTGPHPPAAHAAQLPRRGGSATGSCRSSVIAGSTSRWPCWAPQRTSTCARLVVERLSRWRAATRRSRGARERRRDPVPATAYRPSAGSWHP